MEFNIIAAIDDKCGIGKNGGIPWNLPADRRHFASVTTGSPPKGKQNAVIMGRVTWESLPRRPLPNRLNVVVSSQDVQTADVLTAKSLDEALAQLSRRSDIHQIWVIGGERLYAEAIRHQLFRECVLTHVPGDHECDRHFKPYGDLRIVSMPTDDGLDVRRYYPTNHDEDSYLHLLRQLSTRSTRPNRTGIPTRSDFARRLEFRLCDDVDTPVLPMLTTKTVPFRIVAEELFWFLRGGTDARDLQAKNVHIWDGNSTREFLDRRGLATYTPGELGPVYGFQWRHWGAEYIPEGQRAADHTFAGKGVDQIQRLIDGLKTDPYDRRHIVSAWNVADLSKMALPPCHVFFQFYVEPNEAGKPWWLSCHLYMRSADMFLGVPFNIVSYGLLTHLVAQQTGLHAKRFVLTMGDCHVYENHLEAVQTQLARTPRGFPQIEIRARASIDEYTVEDIVVRQYYPHPAIKAPMAV